MPLYNFKRKVKFYVVIEDSKYLVDIYPDISFSQTFKESSRKVKTLHTQSNMFDEANVNEASPANFSFTMPLYVSLEVKPVLDLLLKYGTNDQEVTLGTADIYVDTGLEIFKLENAVFERGTFNIGRGQVLTVSISGSASKLSIFGSTGTTIPGFQQPTTSNSIFLDARYMLVELENTVQTSISSVSLEVANDINWLPNNDLHKSLAVTEASDTTYPEAFVVSGRVVSGNIQQYLTDENTNSVNTWKIGIPLNIWIGKTINNYSFKIELSRVVYTNRSEVGELFMQAYDFRLIDSPYDLSTQIQYTGV